MSMQEPANHYRLGLKWGTYCDNAAGPGLAENFVVSCTEYERQRHYATHLSALLTCIVSRLAVTSVAMLVNCLARRNDCS